MASAFLDIDAEDADHDEREKEDPALDEETEEDRAFIDNNEYPEEDEEEEERKPKQKRRRLKEHSVEEEVELKQEYSFKFVTQASKLIELLKVIQESNKAIEVTLRVNDSGFQASAYLANKTMLAFLELKAPELRQFDVREQTTMQFSLGPLIKQLERISKLATNIVVYKVKGSKELSFKGISENNHDAKLNEIDGEQINMNVVTDASIKEQFLPGKASLSSNELKAALSVMTDTIVVTTETDQRQSLVFSSSEKESGASIVSKLKYFGQAPPKYRATFERQKVQIIIKGAGASRTTEFEFPREPEGPLLYRFTLNENSYILLYAQPALGDD